MIDFDEWMEKKCSVIQSEYGEEYIAAQEAWDFQQAKIDAVTKQRDSFIKAHHIAMNDVCEHKAKIDELKARVDKAMKYVSESPLKDVSRRAMINFMDILKGNKYEN